MALGQYHITENGPSLCSADPNKVNARGCPYAPEGHFSTLDEAEVIFQEKMGGAFAAKLEKHPKEIELSSNLGTTTVTNGDLSDPIARALLSSGLCGDLALAIQKKTGGSPYFISFTVDSNEALADAFEEDPKSIIYGTNHVLIESPTKPNHFIDAYGQNDYAMLEDHWENAYVLEGTQEMLEYFGEEKSAARLEKFADSAIELDRKGESYEMDHDMLDIDDSDYYEDEDDDDYEVISLKLDLGSVEVINGDLSTPKSRFLFLNGLCGDLAMAVRERQGGDVYFVTDPDVDTAKLSDAASKGTLGNHVAHALLESRNHPGKYIDAYGVKTKEEIESFYNLPLRKVNPQLLESFGSGDGAKRGSHDLSRFAETVATMDRLGDSYDYNELKG